MHTPRKFGGLGQLSIPLLSDVSRKMSKDYGVLLEDVGVSLRGMFVVDGEGLVQQVRTSHPL